MTTITYELKPRYFFCSIDGHSGYDEVGKDIVCASISTLVYYIQEFFDDTDQIQYQEENGHCAMTIIMFGKNGSLETCQSFINTLKSLSSQYPDYVMVQTYEQSSYEL